MLDVLLCYGFAANMIHAVYLGLVTDLFRQVWAAWRRLGAAAAARARRLSRGGAAYLQWASETTTLQRRARLETSPQ